MPVQVRYLYPLLLLCLSTPSDIAANGLYFALQEVSFQGGVGIKRSLDELAAKYLRYDYMEPPRLVSLNNTLVIETLSSLGEWCMPNCILKLISCAVCRNHNHSRNSISFAWPVISFLGMLTRNDLYILGEQGQKFTEQSSSRFLNIFYDFAFFLLFI